MIFALEFLKTANLSSNNLQYRKTSYNEGLTSYYKVSNFSSNIHFIKLKLNIIISNFTLHANCKVNGVQRRNKTRLEHKIMHKEAVKKSKNYILYNLNDLLLIAIVIIFFLLVSSPHVVMLL